MWAPVTCDFSCHMLMNPHLGNGINLGKKLSLFPEKAFGGSIIVFDPSFSPVM